MHNPDPSAPSSELVLQHPGLAAMHDKRFRIPGDTVAQGTENLPEEQRTALRWLFGYLCDRNLGKAESERLLPKPGKSGEYYSWDSIYQSLTGARAEQGANLTPICAAIEKLRSKVEGESRVGTTGFIETRLSRAIFDRFDQARARRRIAYVFGDSQIGKTETSLEYKRTHNHGSTIYLDTPATGARGALVQALCSIHNIGQPGAIGDVEERIADCYDRKMLLIVDNAHRMLRGRRGLGALTFLQWLYDKRGCALAFCMTNEGHGNLLHGPFAKPLEQLWRRRIPPLRLPGRTPDDDLALFAAKYGLSPAPAEPVKIRVQYFDEQGKQRDKDYEKIPAELQADVVSKEGLGLWLETLEEARSQARRANRAMSWKAVLLAHCLMQADGEVLL